MTIFTANPRLVKMSKSWPLLVFVSLKYCADKRLLKTHVVFFMKVTVYVLL
jgi:hypothetical protein